MITLKEVCKQYEDQIIFKDFNLNINDGEFIALTGPSGCGKTTLLNMIGGIEPITKGEIFVNGINIQKQRNKQKFFRDEVAFLFQNFALIENKTVEENLKLVRRIAANETTIETALDTVGMLDKLNQKVYKLSGGEQQRIAIARVIIKKCNIVLADEPTGSLDKRNTEVIINLLRQINEMGKTILIVTHDINVANKCDRIIRLGDL